MTAVSLQCKLKNHHPEWSNVGPVPLKDLSSPFELQLTPIGLQHHLHPLDDSQPQGSLVQGPRPRSRL